MKIKSNHRAVFRINRSEYALRVRCADRSKKVVISDFDLEVLYLTHPQTAANKM